MREGKPAVGGRMDARREVDVRCTCPSGEWGWIGRMAQFRYV
jgi:hypothetical protein